MSVDLQRRIVSLEGEFLLFAVTPPRLSTTPEKAQEIANITLERLKHLDVDGLILYDIDDEADRNPEERPFPFFPTMDPADYLDRHLESWRTPVVVYRATAKYTEQDLRDWMESQDTGKRMAVFVGASSREKRVVTTLHRAQQLAPRSSPTCSSELSRYPSGTLVKATSTFAWPPSKRPAAPTSSPRSFTTSTPPRTWYPTMRMSATTGVSTQSRLCSRFRCAAL